MIQAVGITLFMEEKDDGIIALDHNDIYTRYYFYNGYTINLKQTKNPMDF